MLSNIHMQIVNISIVYTKYQNVPEKNLEGVEFLIQALSIIKNGGNTLALFYHYYKCTCYQYQGLDTRKPVFGG